MPGWTSSAKEQTSHNPESTSMGEFPHRLTPSVHFCTPDLSVAIFFASMPNIREVCRRAQKFADPERGVSVGGYTH